MIDCTISLRSIPLNPTRCSQCHSPRWTFDVLLQTDLFTTRLRCAEPVTITFPQFVPGPVPDTSSRPDKSASTARHPIGICQTAVLREPFTIFSTRVRQTLDFWLSVRLKVNLHDVLNLSSISVDVFDLFQWPQSRLTQDSGAILSAILERPPVIWHPAPLKHSCISP